METITPASVVRRNESLLAAEVGSDLVMLHVERNAYFDTSAVGADIWARLATPMTVRDLCAAVCQTYDVDHATCERDVLQFLNDAYREDVIRLR